MSPRIIRRGSRCFWTFILAALMLIPFMFAADKQKDEKTLRNANIVLHGGRGPMLCRSGQSFNGKWSAPAMFSLGGASIGLQVGGSSTDFVLLLMNQKVVNQVLTGKTKMGTDATAAAGPGATAASASDVDILTYGRAKGAFAGVSLGGATVEPDNDANHRLYDKTLTATHIVRGGEVKPEGEGQSLVAVLDSKVKK